MERILEKPSKEKTDSSNVENQKKDIKFQKIMTKSKNNQKQEMMKKEFDKVWRTSNYYNK